MRRVVYKQKTLTTHGNLRFILAAMTTIRSTQQLTLLLFSNLNYQSKFFFLLVHRGLIFFTIIFIGINSLQLTTKDFPTWKIVMNMEEESPILW